MNDKVAYLAGFFDGEGCIGIYSAGRSYFHLRVIIGQKNMDVLKQYKKIWGGSIYLRIDKRTQRTHHIWQISGQKAGKFVNDIYPFVIEKRKQCKYALQFIKLSYLRGAKRLSEKDIAKKMDIRQQIMSLNSPMGFGRLKEITA